MFLTMMILAIILIGLITSIGILALMDIFSGMDMTIAGGICLSALFLVALALSVLSIIAYALSIAYSF